MNELFSVKDKVLVITGGKYAFSEYRDLSKVSNK
ncbi:MAG: hypothetical protein BWY08_01519 [Bacteroidetes bacterium ADurb.Bin174]|nr:MAG: hypothetical protein BWY08_01519 [Bacteroidetes bacterium ADurb.Bin174]